MGKEFPQLSEGIHCMEKPQEHNENRVQITKAVFNGLEFIRRSGATNMLDRPVVLHLAREWNLTAAADWIESVDAETYGRLIFQRPEVLEDETLDEKLDRMDRAYDEERRAFWEGTESTLAETQEEVASDHHPNPESPTVRSILVELGRKASLVMAATDETEEMGVLLDEALHASINAERVALISNLIEASNLEDLLTQSLNEVQRRIDKLTVLLDPENH